MSILPDAESFRRLADGSARGPLAVTARSCLALAACPYGMAVGIRNSLYDRGILRRHRAGIPVICVGNLTLGGTGKTPLVAWVARLLRSRGVEPAVVSRGYGARKDTTSDEAAELARVLGGIEHVAMADRVAGARLAGARGAAVVILDDGFQHRRLARDLDIVAVDATDPYGCGRLFPRGLLREPLGAIGRADAVVINRAGAVDAARREAIRRHLEAACSGRTPDIWAEADHVPTALRSWDGPDRPLHDLSGMRVAACAGIGNPAAFRSTLEGLGVDLACFHAFSDHHRYSEADLRSLAARARAAGASHVVTTIKDLVRLRRAEIGGMPLLALEIALEVRTNAGPLSGAILAAVGAGCTPQE